jgi:GNAT superfamily N-acetyltransferase
MALINLTDLPRPLYYDTEPSEPTSLIKAEPRAPLGGEDPHDLQGIEIALGAQCGEHREALFEAMIAEGLGADAERLRGKRLHELWREDELVGVLSLPDMDVKIGTEYRFLFTQLEAAYVLPEYRRQGVMSRASFHLDDAFRRAVSRVIDEVAGSEITLISSHTATRRDDAWQAFCESFYFTSLEIGSLDELAKGAEGVKFHTFANLAAIGSP